MLLSGVIKAVRKQAVASIASFVCMVFISLPVGYLSGVTAGWGLPGFWIGYAASGFSLGTIYTVILTRIDWVKVAEVASQDEFSDLDLSKSSLKEDQN